MANAGEHLFTPQGGDEVVRDGHVVARNVIGSGGYTKWFPVADMPGWTRAARPGEAETAAPPAAGDVIRRCGVDVARAEPDPVRGRRGFSWVPIPAVQDQPRAGEGG